MMEDSFSCFLHALGNTMIVPTAREREKERKKGEETYFNNTQPVFVSLLYDGSSR
jgi:hypothetical protein